MTLPQGLYQLIRTQGSYKNLAARLGIHETTFSHIMNGHDISLAVAIKLDVLSKGRVPAECLLAHCGKRKYLSLIKQFRVISQQQVMTHNTSAYCVKKTVGLIDQHALMQFSLLDRLQTIAISRYPLIDEQDRLIIGKQNLKDPRHQQKSWIEVCVIDLNRLLANDTPLAAPYTLTLLERLAIGLALENTMHALALLPPTPQNKPNDPHACPNWDTKANRRGDYIATLCHLGSKNKYHKLKSIAKKGIPNLLIALNQSTLSVHQAYHISRLPRDEQLTQLTNFSQQPQKEKIL